MSAAVPDPRFRDQLAKALYGLMYTRPWAELEDWRQEKWRCDADVLMPAIAAEVEARVQAAANQRAAEYAWSEGYEACRRGEQKRNPYRAAALASPAPALDAES